MLARSFGRLGFLGVGFLCRLGFFGASSARLLDSRGGRARGRRAGGRRARGRRAVGRRAMGGRARGRAMGRGIVMGGRSAALGNVGTFFVACNGDDIGRGTSLLGSEGGAPYGLCGSDSDASDYRQMSSNTVG